MHCLPDKIRSALIRQEVHLCISPQVSCIHECNGTQSPNLISAYFKCFFVDLIAIYFERSETTRPWTSFEQLTVMQNLELRYQVLV